MQLRQCWKPIACRLGPANYGATFAGRVASRPLQRQMPTPSPLQLTHPELIVTVIGQRVRRENVALGVTGNHRLAGTLLQHEKSVQKWITFRLARSSTPSFGPRQPHACTWAAAAD